MNDEHKSNDIVSFFEIARDEINDNLIPSILNSANREDDSEEYFIWAKYNEDEFKQIINKYVNDLVEYIQDKHI